MSSQTQYYSPSDRMAATGAPDQSVYSQWRKRASRIASAMSILTGVWLVGIIFPPILNYPPDQALQLVTLMWIVPLALFFGRRYFVYPAVQRSEKTIRFWTVLFLATIMVSAVASDAPLISLSYSVVTAVGILTAGGLWSCTRHKMPWCLFTYAVLGTTIVTYVYFTRPLYQGRLRWNSWASPNHLALIAFGILGSSLAIRNRLLSYLCIGLNLAVIIAAQARGNLIGALVTLTAYALLVLLSDRSRGLALLKFVGALALLAVFLLVYEASLRQVITDVFLLHDRYRGLGSGLTGRIDAWREAYRLFLDNPIVGVGFRTHERYMTTLSSAHNGYISLLAEIGALGTLSAIGLMIVLLRRLWRFAMAGDRLAIIGVSITLGYAVVAMFDRYFINVGNPTSLLVWLLLFMPDWEMRRTGEIQARAFPGFNQVEVAAD